MKKHYKKIFMFCLMIISLPVAGSRRPGNEMGEALMKRVSEAVKISEQAPTPSYQFLPGGLDIQVSAIHKSPYAEPAISSQATAVKSSNNNKLYRGIGFAALSLAGGLLVTMSLHRYYKEVRPRIIKNKIANRGSRAVRVRFDLPKEEIRENHCPRAWKTCLLSSSLIIGGCALLSVPLYAFTK